MERKPDPAAVADSWRAYADGVSVIRGRFSINGGRVTGTLPAGSTTDHLNVADPELRAAFAEAVDVRDASVLPATLPDLPPGSVIEAQDIARALPQNQIEQRRPGSTGR